jgi:signal transduction histidine kinase
MNARDTRNSQVQALSLRKLLLPVAGVVVVAVLVAAALVVAAVRGVDEHEAEETEHLASAAMRQITDDLVRGAQDYTWWDESVRRVVISLDRAWTGHLWGYYQENFRGNQVVMALAPDDSVIMTWHDGRAWFDGPPIDIEPGLDILIAEARAMPLTRPDPVSSWMLIDGEVYAVAVGAITPSDPVWASAYGYDRGVGIFARQLAPLLQNSVGDDFLLDELRLVPAGTEVDGEFLDLAGPTGEPVARLAWMPRAQGRDIVLSVLLPVSAALLAIIPLLLIFVRQALRTVSDEVELRESLSREREVGAMKSRFVSMVSHEFRTPLTAIMASSELLQHYRDRLTEAEREEELASIEREVDRLTGMIDEVIMLGQADATGLEFRPEEIDLAARLSEISDRALLSTTSKSNITVHGAGDLGTVIADPHLIDLALGNVLGNAVKYSPGGEPVEVAVRRSGDVLSIQVIDRGIGVPEDDLPLLGRPFHRGANAARISGTGLGLAIARSAAEAHGGGFDVESTLGRGTKVTLRLRLGPKTDDVA